MFHTAENMGKRLEENLNVFRVEIIRNNTINDLINKLKIQNYNKSFYYKKVKLTKLSI